MITNFKLFENTEKDIFYYVRNNDLKKVKQYIRAKKDLEAFTHIKTGSSYTLLAVAVKDSNIEMVKLLIDAGADVNTDIDLKDNQVLVLAIGRDISFIKLLLDSGANPYHKNEDGFSIFNYLDKNTIKELVDYSKIFKDAYDDYILEQDLDKFNI